MSKEDVMHEYDVTKQVEAALAYTAETSHS